MCNALGVVWRSAGASPGDPKASGLVARAIEKTGAHGVFVAPPAK